MRGTNASYDAFTVTYVNELWTTDWSFVWNISTPMPLLSQNNSLGNASTGGNVTENPWKDVHKDFYDDVLRPVISFLIGIIGLPTIALLIAVTLTPTYRKYSYSLYLTFMSVYDFIFIAFEFIDSILQMKDRKFIRDFLIWEVPCRLYEHLFYVAMNVSMWMNVAVAADRFIVITFPFKKDAYCNRRNSWIVCGVILLVIHGTGIAYIVHGKVEYFTGYGYYCNGEEILLQFDVFMGYVGGILTSIIAIIIFSVLSVIELFRVKMRRLKMTSQQPTNTKDKTSRATIALLGIGICAFVTQMPFVVNELVRLYARYYDGELWTTLWEDSITEYEIAVKVFEALSFIINIQNFFVLFILNRQFRQDVVKLFIGQQTSKRPVKSSVVTKTTG